MNSTAKIYQTLADLDLAGAPFVCVTLVAARGSVPQEIGAKMLVTTTDLVAGTVGGGRVEEAARQRAHTLLQEPQTSPCELIHWNLQKDIGMTCGGAVTFLFEVISPSKPSD